MCSTRGLNPNPSHWPWTKLSERSLVSSSPVVSFTYLGNRPPVHFLHRIRGPLVDTDLLKKQSYRQPRWWTGPTQVSITCFSRQWWLVPLQTFEWHCKCMIYVWKRKRREVRLCSPLLSSFLRTLSLTQSDKWGPVRSVRGTYQKELRLFHLPLRDGELIP